MGAQLGRTSAAELSKHREACLRFIPTLQKEAKALELPAFVAHHTFFSNEMIEAFAQVVVDNVGTWRELYFGTGLSEIKQEMRSPDSGVFHVHILPSVRRADQHWTGPHHNR